MVDEFTFGFREFTTLGSHTFSDRLPDSADRLDYSLV